MCARAVLMAAAGAFIYYILKYGYAMHAAYIHTSGLVLFSVEHFVKRWCLLQRDDRMLMVRTPPKSRHYKSRKYMRILKFVSYIENAGHKINTQKLEIHKRLSNDENIKA